MNETDLQRVYNCPFYLRDSKTSNNIRFVITDNGQMVGTHWTCFYIEDNKSFYFDSFGGQPDTFLLGQIPKPINCHNYKIQGINCRLCENYCLYIFYLKKEYIIIMLF